MVPTASRHDRDVAAYDRGKSDFRRAPATGFEPGAGHTASRTRGFGLCVASRSPDRTRNLHLGFDPGKRCRCGSSAAPPEDVSRNGLALGKPPASTGENGSKRSCLFTSGSRWIGAHQLVNDLGRLLRRTWCGFDGLVVPFDGGVHWRPPPIPAGTSAVAVVFLGLE